MLTAALILIGLLCLVMTYRYLYMTMLIRWWEEICVLYIVKSGEHHMNVNRYAEVWPLHLIMLYAWEWDIARFIVDQDGVKKVLDYLERPATVESNDQIP